MRDGGGASSSIIPRHAVGEASRHLDCRRSIIHEHPSSSGRSVGVNALVDEGKLMLETLAVVGEARSLARSHLAPSDATLLLLTHSLSKVRRKLCLAVAHHDLAELDAESLTSWDFSRLGSIQTNYTGAVAQELHRDAQGGSWAYLPEGVLLNIMNALRATYKTEASSFGGQNNPLALKAFRTSSATLRAVCSRWRVVHDMLLEELTLSSLPLRGIRGIQQLMGRFPNIKTFSLPWGTDDDSAGDVLEDAAVVWPPLSSVDLRGWKQRSLSGEVKGKTRSTALTTSSNSTRDDRGETKKVVWALGSLKELTSLELRGCSSMTEDGVRSLGRLSALMSLNLESCTQVTDEEVRALTCLTGLKKLDLDSCNRVTDQGVCALTSLSALTSLNLGDCEKVSDEGVRALAGLTGLRNLDLGGCSKVTDSGVKSLSSLSGLTSLDLTCCDEVTDEGVRVLARHSTLTSLNLACCSRVTDVGLQALSCLSVLNSVDLGDCDKVTDAGVSRLGRLPALTYLYLGGCSGLTDEGVSALGKLSSKRVEKDY